MTIELSPAPAPVQTPEVVEQQQQQPQKGEQQQQQQQQSTGFEMELHRACAEGKLDDVRAVLSRGLEQVETLDMSTGCTPIVLAIRANHVDVVRELLSAGAIVPPPGLTNDPVMLSLLYPQPVYSMPPQFMGHQHQQHHPNMPPAEFYPPQPPAFYPQHMQQQQQQQANLPPADVSKTIPCRNFPNCKYGSACVFFHPRTQPGFYGYDQQQQQPPYFNPNNHNGFQPQQQQQHQLQHDTQHQTQQQQSASASDGSVPTASADHTTNTNDSNAPQLSINEHQQPPPQQQLSTAPPPFIPYGMASPPPPAQFGISPMSPPMMPMSPHDPAAAAFYASSPPSNGMMMPPMNGFVPRRQSINQGPNGYAGGKGFHGKKPSFSGGSRPFTNGTNGAANGNGSERRTSSWKDGNPPPCAFFAQGKCRNGEFCKFPHLDAEGTDCRHPDVIRGLLAPAPPLARVPRQMRMGNFSQYDPTRQFVPRAQQQQQQAPVMNGGVAGMEETATSPPIETVPESAPDAPVATEEAAAPEATPAQAQAQAPAPAPAKQQAAAPVVNGNTNGPNTNIARSASQPGVQRFQPNGHGHGFHSRSQSPAPSNVSFHGNGHPRRGGRPFNASVHQNGNSGRSVSAGENKQRVPSADEFPALGGLSLGASANTSPQERSTAQFQNSKTAAQVLSAPAPPKPEPPVPAQAQPSATEEDGVTMDDESDSDAVIVNLNKPATATATVSPAEAATPETEAESEDSKPASPAPAPAAAAKRGPISFASVASSVASAAGLTTAESTPVALKA